MRINATGQVGIGTTAPSEKLTVIGNINVNSEGSYIGVDAQPIPRLGIVKLSGAQPFLGFAGLPFNIKVSAGGDIATSNIFYSVLTIKTTGEVGINTTAPTSKLHVVGLIEYATNALAITGGLTVGAFYHTAGVVKVVI